VLYVQTEGLLRSCGPLGPIDDLVNIARVQHPVLIRVEAHLYLGNPWGCRRLVPEMDPVDGSIHLPLGVTWINGFDIHAQTLGSRA
jgi:hypothetical protein